MSVHIPKGAARTVTIHPHIKGQTAADMPGGLPKKQLDKRSRNQAAFADSVTKPKAAKLHADDIPRLIRENPIPDDIAGISNKRVVLAAIIQTAKDFKGRDITVDHFIGRLLERLILWAPNVQLRLANPLNDSIEMLSFFLGRIHSSTININPKTGDWYGGTGFFDANGDSVYLTGEGRADLIKRVKALGKFTSVDPKTLAKKGLVYADRFRIGGNEYVDGAILMPFAGRYIVLVRIEVKTMFSDGIVSQLSAFFMRLASSSADQKIGCYIAGVYKESGRKQLLFNPTWTDSGVGIQESDKNLDVWKDPRAQAADAAPTWEGPRTQAEDSAQNRIDKPQSPELAERVDKSVKRLQRVPANQRSAFIEEDSGISKKAQLQALTVSAFVLYTKADMRRARNWALKLPRKL